MEELRFHFLLGVEHLVILILIPVIAENSRNGAEIAEIIGVVEGYLGLAHIIYKQLSSLFVFRA